MARVDTATRAAARIIRVRSRVLDLPLPADFRPAWGRGEAQRSFFVTLVEIETEDGITGVTAAEAGPEGAVAIERLVTPHLVAQHAPALERLLGVLHSQAA